MVWLKSRLLRGKISGMLACLRVATRYLGLYVPNHIYSTIYKETWKEELMPITFVIESFFSLTLNLLNILGGNTDLGLLDVKLGDIGLPIGGLMVLIHSA